MQHSLFIDKKLYLYARVFVALSGLHFMKNKHQEFRNLYDTYAREMYWIALALCGDECLSEDCVHEVFVQVWESYDDLHEVRNQRAFLTTMTRNRVLDNLRHIQIQRRHEQSIAYELEQSNLDDEDNTEELISRAKSLLDKLPEKCREIFLLAVLDGLSYKEIADAKGISVNTVKTQMKIARRKLKDDLPFILFALINFRNLLS